MAIYSRALWKIPTLDRGYPLVEKGTQSSTFHCRHITYAYFMDLDEGVIFKQAIRPHSFAYSNDLEALWIMTGLVSMFVDVGCIHEAHKAFDALLCLYELSWNTLITGHVKYGNNLYQRLQMKKLFYFLDVPLSLFFTIIEGWKTWKRHFVWKTKINIFV